MLLGFALPATLPTTRGALVVVWGLIFLIGTAIVVSSPPFLRRVAGELAPYLPSGHEDVRDAPHPDDAYLRELRGVAVEGQRLARTDDKLLEYPARHAEYLAWRERAFEVFGKYRPEDAGRLGEKPTTESDHPFVGVLLSEDLEHIRAIITWRENLTREVSN